MNVRLYIVQRATVIPALVAGIHRAAGFCVPGQLDAGNKPRHATDHVTGRAPIAPFWVSPPRANGAPLSMTLT
jgi:hypothetical protein